MMYGFPGGAVVKNLPTNAGLIPGLGRSPGVRNGNPLQYSCLENSMARGAWKAIIHGVAESNTTEHADNDYIVNSRGTLYTMIATFL